MTWPTKTDFVDGDVLTAAQVNNIGTNLNEADPTGITDGYVLTADGADGMGWEAIAADSMTQIATGSISGASVSITSIPGTYKDLILICRDIESVSNASWRVTLNADAGSNYSTINNFADSGTVNSYANKDNTAWYLTPTGPTNSNTNGTIWLHLPDYANTSNYQVAHAIIGYKTSYLSSYNIANFAGYYESNSAISSIQLNSITSNFSSGTYILYGVK